jgi:hypothetical protein
MRKLRDDGKAVLANPRLALEPSQFAVLDVDDGSALT